MTKAPKQLDDGNYISPDESLKRLEDIVVDDSDGEMDVLEEPGKSGAKPIPIKSFRIESLDDRYRIHNVEHQGELYVVDWSKELLDEGNMHTQKDWRYIARRSQFTLASAPFYTSTIFALYNDKEHPDLKQRGLVEEVGQMFEDDFSKHWMMTSTGALYKSQGEGMVTHGWGPAKSENICEHLVGRRKYIEPQCGARKVIGVVLGTTNLVKVKHAYEWISGRKPYFYRLNNLPEGDIERAVVLGFDLHGRLGINCIGYDGFARGCSVTRAEEFYGNDDGKSHNL
ncbi:hypothetical protein HQ545_07550 [Candidatus Woesearchaeota archaeon]|nr:hypothetical protein [Candidatus Woesearchaeota archaeon]